MINLISLHSRLTSALHNIHPQQQLHNSSRCTYQPGASKMRFGRRDPIDNVQWEMVTRPSGLPRSQSQPALPTAPPPPPAQSLTISANQLRKSRASENLRNDSGRGNFPSQTVPRGQHRSLGLLRSDAVHHTLGAPQHQRHAIAEPATYCHEPPPGLPREFSSTALTSLVPDGLENDDKTALTLLELPLRLRKQIWINVLVLRDGIYVCRCG